MSDPDDTSADAWPETWPSQPPEAVPLAPAPPDTTPTWAAPGSVPPGPPGPPGGDPALPPHTEPYDPTYGYAYGAPAGYPVGYPYGPGYGWAPPVPAAKPSEAWMHFPADRPPPRWGIGDIFLGLLAWFGLQLLVGIPILAATDDKVIFGIASLAAGWVAMVGYLVLISKRKGYGSLRVDFGWDFKWIDPAIGLGVAFATLMVSGIVRVVVANLFSAPAGDNATAIFGDAVDNRAALLVMALMAGIGAPIVEELFFRGLALRAFERRGGAVVGVLGSTTVFALLHWQPGSLGSTVSLVSGIAIYGLFFALITRYTGRLGPSTFAHMMINTLASSLLVYSVFSGNGLGV